MPLYTKCQWSIQLDNEQKALHELSFVIYNLSERIPQVQERIEIILPDCPFEEWQTKVINKDMGPGYGYHPSERDKVYRLEFRDIISNIENPDNPEISVKVIFIQKKAVSKINNFNIYNSNYKSRFPPSSIEYCIQPPKVVTNWRKLLLRILSLITRKELILNYDLNTFGHIPRIDAERGRIIYQFEQVLPGFGIIYRSINSIDIFSFIVGGISITLLERGVEVILKYLNIL